ncbi:hypothetical protein Trco_003702 [Trichoderma cornu-damae]|uniref:DUF7924 domain-containing protein n=1 Tax=Trichoderma cornu-damae TaxID=654480 RepID=A0A9P8TXJ4_9HYPO|nr:hypothetical protein Trco_003702 [Trichoderma cornu-damae]
MPRPSIAETVDGAAAAADVADPSNPIDFWRRSGYWPSQYFEPGMERVFARKRFLFGGPKRSNSTASTPGDQKPWEDKSRQYRDPRYEILLQTKGTFMRNTSELGVKDGSKRMCRDLLMHGLQPTPQGTVFDDPLFERACSNLQGEDEPRIIQDIARLIVPSAETLALYCGNGHLAVLREAVNAGWNSSIPLTGIRPQPDYSVGFRRDAFTQGRLAKLSPFVGDFVAGDLSFFMATHYVYFPFLTCETKCGAPGMLEVAELQNAHSMTLAARAIVELFRLVDRQGEVDRQIVAFSISHDHQSVQISGYYPVLDGEEAKYYRHPIAQFYFTALGGKERWTAYHFAKNVYDIWMPYHFQWICSAIDQLPSDMNLWTFPHWTEPPPTT